MNVFKPEGSIINTAENINRLKSPSALAEAMREKRILEARAAVCDSSHNLIVDLGCMRGVIPRDEGAVGIKEGAVRDIAVISRVGKPVCFYIERFQTDSKGNTVAFLSRRAVQQDCINDYISNLEFGDVIDATVTHMESFGAFADIGCGVPSLIPIDSISVSRISHPRDRFCVGMNIKAVVKSINDDGRITLSHKELLGTWEENAENFCIGETVAGIVRSVEDYGIFVELTPNLAGLAEVREGVFPGQRASVYIKSIVPEKMKIKLVIIDSFFAENNPGQPEYFFKGKHMDRFLYSPAADNRVIETVFK